MRNVYKYLLHYSISATAEFVDGEPFRTIIKLGETVEKIIFAMKNNSKITIKDLMEITGLTRRGIEWNLDKLKKEGRIKRIEPDKGGYWKIIQDGDD